MKRHLKRQYWVSAIAVVIAMVIGVAVWAGVAAGTGDRLAETGSPSSAAPATAGMADSPSVAGAEATGTASAVPGPSADPAAPVDPAAPSGTASDAAPAGTDVQVLPARSVGSCVELKNTLAAYQQAGLKSGPSGFEMLLMGLDELSGSVEILAATDDAYQPVVENISVVRRQWSTSYAAFESGDAADAAKASQAGMDTLQAIGDSLLCHP